MKEKLIEKCLLTKNDICELPVSNLSGLPFPISVARKQLQKAIPLIASKILDDMEKKYKDITQCNPIHTQGWKNFRERWE